MTRTRRTLLALAGLALAVPAAPAAAQVPGAARGARPSPARHLAAAAPTIAIVRIDVRRRVATVTVRITHWIMDPTHVGGTPVAGHGHWHIYVDGHYVTFSANARRGKTKRLAAGTHRLRVVLARNNHAELRAAASKRFTVA